ncbi:hypothetical protein SNE40_020174 [Patella caerulea]|uniref:Large ribosomal subunit protein bL27m n=1 Tax=Patella caerulea TaxID=87958 RepID=A0AAN8G299_PATCE
MSASLLRGLSLKTSNFLNISGFLCIASPTEQVRYASKKAGGAVRNKKRRTLPKYRGWKRNDGSFVHAGEILATQRGLRFYPGENVELRRDNALHALRDGIVMVTSEVISPYPDSPLYTPVQSGLVIKKKFFNVYPTPLHAKFKLVSEI